jgi:S1-C subfamily serine protease
MKSNLLIPFLWMSVFILIIGLACSAGSNATPVVTSAPAQTEVVQPSEPPPVKTEQPAPPSGAISSLQDVKKATIQIESQGTFIDPQVGLVQNGAGRGSGFIIDPSGIAVTNNHVVTGAALLKVWVGGEKDPRNARVLGVSECSDLAVIDIEGDGYDYLDWYTGPIDVGMDIYVAGFPLGDPEFTLTKGVISKAKADGKTSWSSVESVLEYDATTNPGNSGGPVVTPDGQVIAVHYAGSSQTRQAFGISEVVAKDVVAQLQSGENIDTVGVNGQAVSNEDGSLTGVWVASVQSGSPADKAGVKAGDVLTKMENLVLASDGTMSQYCDILRSHQPEDALSIQVLRWADNQVLEGQLNGRQLAVTESGGTTSSGGEPTPGATASGEEINPNASQSGDVYYSTQFDDNPTNWKYYLMNGKEEGFSAETTNGKFRVDIEQENTWIYFMYDEYAYTDVRIDTSAENLGRNTNNVSLICRESDAGWYEFNVYNSGKYNILWYDDVVKKDYVTLYSGASTAINMGQGINEYTAICAGTSLTLGINGVEVKTVTHKSLKDGRVGFGVSSFNVLPIIVEFDYFTASVP